jgi:hypothetical protein
MKWLTPLFKAAGDGQTAPPLPLKDLLEDAARTTHLVFMTDSGRRSRFAALTVLNEILALDLCTDILLHTRPDPVTFAVNSVSLQQSVFFDDKKSSFRENMLRYLIRLAGAAFSPHLLQLGGGEESLVDSNGATDLGPFLSVTPNILSYKDSMTAAAADGGAGNNTTEENVAPLFSASVEKLATKESLRIETCCQVIRLLCALTEEDAWGTSLSAVLRRIFEQYLSPSRDVTSEMLPALKIDMIGASLLLGGGAAGKYLGVEVQNFFGSAHSVILNINNTTNFVTLLSWNMSKSARQISRMRLGDVTVITSSSVGEDDCYIDKLSLSQPKNRKLMNALLPTIVALITDLAQFSPLLINDFLSTLQVEHPYQSKVLLRSLRPVELLIFNQLLKCVAFIKPSLLAEDETAQVLGGNPAFAGIVQQAASATLCISNFAGMSNSTTYGGGAQSSVSSCIGYSANCGVVNVDEVEETGLHVLWMKSAKYALSLPSKLGYFPLLRTPDSEKQFFNFVAQYYGIAVESLLSTPFEWLLRRGRLNELVHCLAVGTASFVGVQLPSSDLSTCVDDKFLISDWTHVGSGSSGGQDSARRRGSSGGLSSYLSEISSSSSSSSSTHLSATDSEQVQVEAAHGLQLLFHLRESVIRHSRRILQRNDFICPVDRLTHSEAAWKMVVWESTLPLSVSLHSSNTLPLLLGFYDEVCTRLRAHSDAGSSTESAWRRISHVFQQESRVEVTQTIASTLRYAALSLLETSSIRAMDNILETVDLFKRIVQCAFHWIDFNRGEAQETEVYFHVLKTLLPSLSFIDSAVIELQLMQVCMYTIRKLLLCVQDGYVPSKELLELAKSNNFTLLRARAQEQMIKYKCHSMGSVSPLAYNLTHIVTGLEMLQRYGCHLDLSRTLTLPLPVSESSNPSSATTPRRRRSGLLLSSLAARLAAKESTGPKIIGVRSSSIDADLNGCAANAVRAISHELSALQVPDAETLLAANVVMIEVAIAAASSAGHNGSGSG